MQFPATGSQDWMKTLQELLHYYLPVLKPSVASVGACLAAVAVGLVVAFRSAKVARGLVCLLGMAIGAGTGYQIAMMAGGPAPVSAAIGGVVLGAIAWRTYKLWLAIGSVLAIVGAAMAFQLISRGDLSTVLREVNGVRQNAGPQIVGRLSTPTEQLNNLSGESRKQLEKAWASLTEQFKSWGLSGWIWPALALVAGIILALWALQVMAVMWLGLVGAALSVAGALGLGLMQFPQVQQDVVRRPDYVLGAVAIIWIFGLVWQAKSGRLGGKPAVKAAPRRPRLELVMAVATLRTSVIFCLCSNFFLWPSMATGQSRPASQPASLSVEDEVLANILNQRIGDRTVADDGLPEDYLRRVADRVIRASYQQVFRVVVDDRGVGASQPGSPPRAGVSTRPAVPGFSIYEHALSPHNLSAWQALPESRPPLRGFRAPIVPDALEQPFGPLPPDAPAEVRGLAAIVSRGLAKNGLLRTTAEAMLSFGAGSFVDDTRNSCDVLAVAGLPVDLLGYFGGDRSGEKAWISAARKLAKGLESGKSIDEAVASVAKDFQPHASGNGFRASVDSGDGSFGTLRLQLTRGDYWMGEGDGGSVDIARQLVARLPDVRFLISVESDYVGTLFDTARNWRGNGLDRMRLVTEQMTVSQWAQDDARAGEMASRDAKGQGRAILAPRYASRGEDGSILVPGDSLLLSGLRAAGETVFQSPLLFQGGNLIVYRDPRDGRRTLLISEADIYRNHGLGLSRSEALEAFRVELGVDRCEVFPAISYHIDYEVSVRAHAGVLLAFVNDTLAASRIIIDCGLEALLRKGLIAAEDVRRARAALSAGRTQEVLELAAGAVFARANPDGQFPISLADAFSAGPTDSGVGNLRRFLVACDELAAHAANLDEPSIDRNSRAYLGSLRRREAERGRLREQLTVLGLRVVPVPSLSDAEQSINYVNGLHDASKYLMPAYGGIFAKLDDAAVAAFSAVLGPEVQVLPIYCSESQRRDGAVRCSVSVYTDHSRDKLSGDR